MKHQSFVDWMKAIGMLLIVIGHVIGGPYHIFNEVNQPIYTKQLGVSFFVFVMGWGLANETRNGIFVVYNRLFAMYFWGLLAAVTLSVIFFFVSGDLVESNYLPFFFGINVLFDNFPANPTTWYIGTYLHILLFWLFVTKGKKVGIGQIILAAILENLIRCIILYYNKDFIAYMLLPNWLTVFLLGSYFSDKQDGLWSKRTTILLITWFAVMAAWSNVEILVPFNEGFPWRDFVHASIWTLPVRSALITVIYVFNTIVAFEVFRCLRLFKPISFFARNTIIIFIAHMPIIFQFSSQYYNLFESRAVGSWSLIIVIFVGLGLFSEAMQRMINVKALSQYGWRLIAKLVPNLK